ncbi:MAG: ABC transporter permease subunit [Pseudonocardiaceae bacterium]|nr:ABC transporter permease subunit [Pseudonocardiaceae bacterium]
MSETREAEQPVTAVSAGSAHHRRTWGDLPTVLRRGIVLVALLGAWQLSTLFMTGAQAQLMRGPLEVGEAIVDGFARGDLVDATLTTLRILLLSMAIGIVVAALLTTFAMWSKLGDDILNLLTAMINPLPAIALLPLAMIWIGLNTTALVVIIANAVIWPLAINVSTGFRTVNPTLLAVGRNIGLSGWRLVRGVYLPAALPHIVSGIKTGWAFGWRTIIAAELVFGVAGEGGGLGYFINYARFFNRTEDMFAGIVTIMIIGIAFDLLFSLLERKTVIKWGMKTA